VTPDGKVSWTGFIYNRLEIAFKLAVVVISPAGEELNESASWQILRSAAQEVIKKLGGKRPLPADAVLKAADSKAADYFRKSEDAYVLISSLSVESLPFKKVRVAGCEITPLSSRKKYPFPPSAQHTGVAAIGDHIKSSRYQLVSVRTSGRNAHEAADKAFRALNLLRGVWSLSVTYGSWTVRIGGVNRDPLGVIRTGPIHTLHHPNGKLVGDFYFYERAATEDRHLFKPNVEWQKIEKNRRWVMNHIRRLPFGNDVEDLIIRYVIALDQTDHDAAFLQMWSILEKITNTVGANYDETIRRTVWLFSDRSLARDFLECARLQRNLLVHAAKSTEEPDQAAYLIKSFVEPHLTHLIQNGFGLSTLEEYGQHLCLPTDLKTLQRNRRWIAKAIRFQIKKASKK
jgi:hypothetical protein